MLLQLTNVEVVYSDVILVLKGVNLEVEEGKIVTLLGANGAGKTTTLKAISGLLRSEDGAVTAGSITFQGAPIEAEEPQNLVRRGLVQVVEGRKILPHMTVEQNLLVGGKVLTSNAERRRMVDRMYGYFPKLRDMRGRTSGYLSGGEQQMLVIGRALMAKPRLVLLDEPSLGLAPIIVAEIFNLVNACATRRASPSSWSSRTPRLRSASPTTATSWRTAASCCSAAERSCARTRTSRNSIWA